MNWIEWLFPQLDNLLKIENRAEDLADKQIFVCHSISMEDFQTFESDPESLYHRLSLLNYSRPNKKYTKPVYEYQYVHVHQLHSCVINNTEVDFAIDNSRRYVGPTDRKYSIYLDGKLLFRISKTSTDDYNYYQRHGIYEPLYKFETDSYFSLEEISKIYPLINEYLQNIYNTDMAYKQKIREQREKSMTQTQAQVDIIKSVKQTQKTHLLNKLLSGTNSR